MNKQTKNNLLQILSGVAVIASLLITGLSTEKLVPHLIIPAAVGLAAGALQGYLKTSVTNWRDGLLWGVIGFAAGGLAYLAI